MIFVPTSCNNVFFFFDQVCFFSVVFFLLKKLGCVMVISFLIPRFFFKPKGLISLNEVNYNWGNNGN